jgi:RNA polymerase sigma-70 factor (ECF subfamily)
VTRTEEFEAVRPLLFAIARRILGSESRAEDAVEATGLRWARTPVRPPSIESHLAAEVTRICVDALRTARPRPDAYPAAWPCGPSPERTGKDPWEPVELADSLLTAALLVLERLSPLERAVFVLREAFGCSVAEIAAAVGCSQEACRQLVDSVAVTSDGGREPLPWPTHITGAGNVARLLAAIVPALVRIGIAVEKRAVDGRPGSVFRDRNGTVLNAMVLGVHDDRIDEVHLVVNLEQMVDADPVAEAYAILREANRPR